MAVIVAAAAIYLHSLAAAPVYIGVDEARFAIRAHAIATTGRSLEGDRLPLFFHITNPIAPDDLSPTWWQPTLFYLTAGVFRFAGLSEWSVRVPTTVLALIDLLLIFGVSSRLFGSRWLGVAGAFLLALTPAHFIFARQAQDYVCLVPVALAWLWCLQRCIERDEPWLPLVTGIVLGVGVYGHISAWIVMPCYLAVTMLVLWLSGKPRSGLALLLGFAIPLLPLLLWLRGHPDLLGDMFTNYKVGGGLRLAERVEVLWAYFSPSFLFFSGGSNPMFATRRAGVFLLAAIALIPLGIRSVLLGRFSIPRALLLFGFFFAPVPIALALPEDGLHYTPRALLMVPFGVLLGVAGIEWLVAQRRLWSRLAMAVLLLSMPLQFALFARNYFTDYQEWAAYRFDGLNLREVAAFVIDRDRQAPVPAIYMSEDVGEAQANQWVFQLLRRDRRDLWTRTKRFKLDEFNPMDAPSGSVIVVDAKNPLLPALLHAATSHSVHVVNGAAGLPAATILVRQ